MATSGSINFLQTRNELITDALGLIGAYGVGRTISSEDMSYCSNTFNRMIKAWQGKGLHLWAQERGYIFLDQYTSKYILSSDSSSAKACLQSDAVITQLNGAVAALGTSLTVDTTTGMTAADVIGIVQTDNSTHWTTIVSVDSSTTLTITTGLVSAAADNKNVYTFTSRLTKPLRIHRINRVTGVDTTTTASTSTPVAELSQQEYDELSTKASNGTVVNFYYNPKLTTGNLFVWQRPDDTSQYLEVYYDRMLEDFDAATNTPDMPSEWHEAIVYQLAYRLAPAFGKDKNMVQPEASMMLEDLLSWDNEVTSLYLSTE